LTGCIDHPIGSKVPADVRTTIGCGGFEVLKHLRTLWAIHINFRHQEEALASHVHALVFDELLDLLRRTRLLATELVARKGKNDEPLFAILLV
jgi:hypothetical protein